MAKKPKPEGKKYNYMDTYGDLVTLLMCFFVLLFAMSTVEETRYNAFVEALTTHFGPTPRNLSTVQVPNTSIVASDFGDEQQTGDMAANQDQTLPADFQNLGQAISDYVEANNMQGEISVQTSESGATFIRLSDNLLFAGNSYELSSQATEFLDFLGDSFLSVEGKIFRIYFNGHTASIAGSGTDDWILSSARSGRVASYFERTVKFPFEKLETRGFGRHYPIADNSTPEGVARNRRVDIVVLGNNPDTLLMSLAEASAVYFPDDSTEFFTGNTEDLPGNVLPNFAPGVGVIDTNGLTAEQVDALQAAVSDVAATNGSAPPAGSQAPSPPASGAASAAGG